jgi:hypothetical protein
MGTTIPNIVDDLVDEEISRMVADAVKDGRNISTSRVTARIARMFPSRRYGERELSARITIAASAAGVPLNIRRSVSAG